MIIIVLCAFSEPIFAQENKVEIPVSLVSQLNKTIILDLKNVQIEEILKNISSHFGVNFTYVNNDIPLNKIISIRSENQSLKSVLDQIFQGTLVKHYEIETQILLKKEDEIQVTTQSDSTSSTKTDSISPKNHFENARYSVLKNGKYIKYFSLYNLVRFKFTTAKRKKIGLQPIQIQQDKIDSLNLILKDSTITKKVKRKVVRQKRKIKLAAKPFYKLILGLYGAPEITFRQLKGKEANEVSDRNKMEDWRWNFSAGVSLDYYFTKHWFLRSGVSYLNFGEIGKYRVSKPYILPNQTLNTDTIISYKNNLALWGVPLCVGFKTGGKLSFAFNAGIIIGFLPDQRTTYPAESQETYTYTADYVVNPRFSPPNNRPNPFNQPPYLNPNFQQKQFPNNQSPITQPIPIFKLEADPPPQTTVTEVYSITTTAYYYRDYLDPRTHVLRNIHFISALGIDLGYEFSKKFSVVLSPTFNYFLTSKYANGDTMNEKPYSFAVKIGAFYKFGMRRSRYTLR